MRKRRLRWLLTGLIVFLAASQGMFGAVRVVSAQTLTPTPSSTPELAAILSPLPNQAVRGVIPVNIRIDVQDVQSVELAFSYTVDPTRTWFFIYQSDGPVQGEKLVDWDTTTLTDGNYTLRMVVTRQDGSQLVARSSGLRVRNYTPIETNTPIPTDTPAPGEPPPPTITPTRSPTPIFPTPTSLPANPVQLSTRDVLSNLWQGVLGALVLFGLLGVYATLRRRMRE